MTPIEVVREGFALALALAWPLVAAAAAGVAATALLGRWSGVQDPALGLLARMIAVVVALVVLVAAMAASLREFTDRSWAELPALGRTSR